MPSSPALADGLHMDVYAIIVALADTALAVGNPEVPATNGTLYSAPYDLGFDVPVDRWNGGVLLGRRYLQDDTLRSRVAGGCVREYVFVFQVETTPSRVDITVRLATKFINP